MDNKYRVLYIEDDSNSQRLVERILSSHGYEVFIAADGLTGVALARQIQPHLILIDINLPHMDGRAVTTLLQSLPQFAEVPIVALTANGGPGNYELALAAGCVGFITKPIDVDDFPRQIELFLQGCKETLSEEKYQQQLQRHTQQIVEQLEDKVRELESMNQLLLKLDRIKSDFITLTWRQVRTPLTLVKSQAQVLNKQLGHIEDEANWRSIVETVDTLNEGVIRMQQVVDEVIYVSRVTAGLLDLNLEPVVPAEIMAEIGADLQSFSHERQLSVQVDDLSHLPTILGDKAQLAAAVKHILESIIKYTNDGGCIYITGRFLEDVVELAIHGTGLVPVEEQRQVFEQSHASGFPDLHPGSSSAFPSANLGLTIAKGIVEAHNGRIWVESERQEQTSLPGSVFRILLPCYSFTDPPDQHG